MPGDYVFIYNTRADYEADSFGFSVRKENGFEWELLEDQALRDYDPIWGPQMTCAARFPGHGRITDPGRYVKDLAAHAVSQGARLVIGEVTDLAREKGAVTGVRVGGETIPCDAAVITTGVWSGPLARKLGVNAPL